MGTEKPCDLSEYRVEKEGSGTVEPVQMNSYQSNTYRKDLSWLHFNDEARVQER